MQRKSHASNGRSLKRNPPARRRRNSGELEAAAELSEKFHGRPAHTVTEITELVREAVDLTDLGRAMRLHVRLASGTVREIPFKKQTRVMSAPTGRQLYLVGGDQSLDLDDFEIPDTGKHQVVLGEGVMLSYLTRKAPTFELVEWEHNLGEESGIRPSVNYDVLNGRIHFAGGNYYIEDVPLGEVSPGIVD